jgi:hypothetical protein
MNVHNIDIIVNILNISADLFLFKFLTRS